MTEERTTTIIDGYIIDTDTGEVLGHVEAAEFHVRDQSSAEWVMERLSAAEADVQAVKDRRAAILDNLAMLERRAQNRVDWLWRRFGSELREFARCELGDGKKRSILTPYGRFGFREFGGTTSVREGKQAEAVTWCKANAPVALKVTTSILVSALPADVPFDLFEYTRKRDKFFAGGQELLPGKETQNDDQ